MTRRWNFSTVRLTTYLLLALSLVVLGATVYMTWSIDVLKDWKLKLPDQEIRVNDRITIQSTYEKVMNVKGESVRYLDCENRGGVVIRYPLNQAVADRAAGKGGSGVVVVIPDVVPDLPAKCRVAIVIDYPVLPWRHVIETEQTDEFTLYPVKESSAADALSGTPETSQTPQQVSGQSSASSSSVASSSQSAPNNTSAQRDISQGEAVRRQTVELPPIPVQPGVTGVPLLDGVIRGLGL